MSGEPAAALHILLGPGAGGTIEPEDLSALADWYLQSPAGSGRYVRASMVSTVDGAAAVAGRSGTISPPVDRAVFRALRGISDVILVGAGTARAENYGPWQVPDALAATRNSRGQALAPVIAQVSRSGQVHTGRGLFESQPGLPRHLAIVAQPGEAAGSLLADRVGADAVIHAPDGHGGVDLGQALQALADRGLTRVLCEGGPALLAAMVEAGLVDELCLTVSPLIGVGDSGRIVQGTADQVPRTAALHALAASGSTLLTRWLIGPATPPASSD